MQATEFEQTFMAYRTTLEMMKDRGYFVSQTQQQITEEQFQEKHKTFV